MRRAGGAAARARRPATSRSTVRGWYNPTLNYQHYMVPGILVALVTMIGTLLSAQNIAREKELGTIEQLNVTPMTRGQFITAKLLPFWASGCSIWRSAYRRPASCSASRCKAAWLLLFAAAAHLSGRWRWRSDCGFRRSSKRSSRRCS